MGLACEQGLKNKIKIQQRLMSTHSRQKSLSDSEINCGGELHYVYFLTEHIILFCQQQSHGQSYTD